MRRILLWALSTVTVVVLLLGYRTSTDPTALGGTSVVVQQAGDGGVTSGGSSDGSSSDGSGGGGSSDATTGTTTVTGDVVQTRWGPVQVEITVADGTITAVDVPVYPSENPKDQQINSYAVPELVQETLDAQSAGIDMVSGATVTSEGYVRSLQSALDEAGL
ncbi:FMN-binding protein [Isoptericola aurantiacus]|uniref:FMN-binding protein n=1 Tax=Isoptericola aurantiacus TaxID=3377839 RepID=UPI00383BD79E